MNSLTVLVTYALDRCYIGCYIKKACRSDCRSTFVFSGFLSTWHTGNDNITRFKAFYDTVLLRFCALETILIDAAHLA